MANKPVYGPGGFAEEAPRPLISSDAEFLAIRKDIATHPRGAALLFIHALLNLQNPQTQNLGEQLLVLSLIEDQLVPGNTYKNWKISNPNKQRIDMTGIKAKKGYLARSYAVGSNPDNNYEFDPNSVSVFFKGQDQYVGSIESGTYKVFIWSSGADSARPVTLKRNPKGIWKVYEFSSLLVGCRSPVVNNYSSAVDDL